MTDINWELIKFKFEVLGISLEELSRDNHLSLPVLKYNSQTWKQIPLASQPKVNLEDVTSLEEIITKLGSQTTTHSKAFAILKQKFLGPKYIELETVLLHKAIEMAESLNLSDPKGASTLRSLTGVLSDLLEHNPLLRPDAEDDDNSEARTWRLIVEDAGDEN